MPISGWGRSILLRASQVGRSFAQTQTSLRHPDAALERNYLVFCAKLISPRLFAMTCCILPFIVGNILVDFAESNLYVGEAGATLQVYYRASLLVFAAMDLAMMLVTRCWHMLGSWGPATLETAAVLFFSCCAAGGCVTNRMYVAKSFGIDPTSALSDDSSFDDARVLLIMQGFLLTTHVLLPIQWRRLIIIELVTVGTYAFAIYILGSWHRPTDVHRQLAALSFIVVISSLGKHLSENRDRALFKLLAMERTQRFSAEQQLEGLRRDSHGAMRDNDMQSADASSGTAELFSGLVSLNGISTSHLERVAELGMREHWLINAENLQFPQLPEGAGILGAGSFGVVIPAIWHGLVVAVKAPRSSSEALSIEKVSALANELRILRRLRHPHIVLLHGALIDAGSGEMALVMEYAGGQHLDTYVTSPPKPLNPGARLDILLQICGALRYLHAHQPPIVHGDLKGSNIIVEEMGVTRFAPVLRAKLMDFGLSRIITRRARPLGGTVAWMAPELFTGVNHHPDTKVDVYSFGRIVYLVVTGLNPSGILTKSCIIRCMRQGSIPPLVWPCSCAFSEQSQALCEDLLRFEPSLRPDIIKVHSELLNWMPNSVAEMMGAVTKGGFQAALRQSRLRLQQQQQQHPKAVRATANHARQTASGPSVEQGGSFSSSRGSAMLMQPKFKETPDRTKDMCLLEAMLGWNCIVPSGTCCRYHAVVARELPRLYATFLQDPCVLCYKPYGDWQCPLCLFMGQFEQGDDEEDFQCLHCGYTGSVSGSGHLHREGVVPTPGEDRGGCGDGDVGMGGSGSGGGIAEMGDGVDDMSSAEICDGAEIGGGGSAEIVV
eukprot:NODE_715_length_2810_cov_50.103243.p1 GENE.NODE_715_length_2810_cov_50.103243~~NODE_715_length_2810_cov_50.103243.p1  ORF type:complete len:835 (-),score=151.73 NODE_715_length_2810_cov_50.103243:196-2700(-)